MPKEAAAPGPPSAGRARNPHTHQAILDATVALLAEIGYQELSIERVAARAGWQGHHLPLVELQERAGDRGDGARDAARRGAAHRGSAHRPAGHHRGRAAHLVGHAGGRHAARPRRRHPRDPSTAERIRQFLRPRRDAAREVLHSAAAVGAVPADVDIETIIDLCVGTIYYRKLVRGVEVDDVLVEQLVSLILDGRLPRTD